MELLYGAQVNVKRKRKNRSLQNKTLRIVCNGIFRAHSDPIFSKCELLKFENLYKINVQSLKYDYFRSNHHLI